MVRTMRSDGFPEKKTWTDKGCKYHPSCFTCPFEKCRYDEPVLQGQTRLRASHARALEADGVTPTQIEALLHVSKRTVQRMLAGGK